MGKNGKRIDAPNVNSFVVGVGRDKPKPAKKAAASTPAPAKKEADDPAPKPVADKPAAQAG